MARTMTYRGTLAYTYLARLVSRKMEEKRHGSPHGANRQTAKVYKKRNEAAESRQARICRMQAGNRKSPVGGQLT